MTPSRRAWNGSLALLALLGAAVAQEDEGVKDPRPAMTVLDGTPPVLDGKVGQEEWVDGFPFEVRRAEEVFGRGRIKRAGRQLYIAYESSLNAFALGVRFNFRDPVSLRMNPVLVLPMNPPRAPLAMFRQPAGREAEFVPIDTCDLRMDLSRLEDFSFELRVPMDLLEIPRSDKPYEFAVEVWDLEANRPIAFFPLLAEGVGGAQVYARLVPKPDWGVDAKRETPEPNEPLKLFSDLHAVGEDGAATGPLAFTGWRDGRRKEKPLVDFVARLAAAVEARPEYIGLRATLVQLRMANNDPAGALEVLEGIVRDFPLLRHQPWAHLVKSELLRALGRYDDALRHLEESGRFIGNDQHVEAEKGMLRYLRRIAALEDRMREADAARDDLPRVRLTVAGKGDVVIELFEDDAPNSVANFLSLVERGAYDGTKFHWVEGGRYVLGGAPNSRDEFPFNDGFGDPGYTIESEPGRRMHLPFTVAYADKRRSRRTEGSTFVIHLAPFPQLDGVNTVLGRVVEGFDVVRRIEQGDAIGSSAVLRKRDHPYTVARRPPR